MFNSKNSFKTDEYLFVKPLPIAVMQYHESRHYY